MTINDLVDFIALSVLYFLVFYRKWKARGREALLVNTLMYVYLAFVMYFTLMPVITSLPFMFDHPYRTMNLVPFVDVLNRRGDFVRQIGLNIIMTIPFGILLPLTQQNMSLLKVIIYTFLLSLSIEILQPLINNGRSSDITDIITNVIGGGLGYMLYLPLKVPLRSMLEKISKGNHN